VSDIGRETQKKRRVSGRRGEKYVHMALSKKRKVDKENRAFNPKWTDSFMFILPTGSEKPVCVICSLKGPNATMRQSTTFVTKHTSRTSSSSVLSLNKRKWGSGI